MQGHERAVGPGLGQPLDDRVQHGPVRADDAGPRLVGDGRPAPLQDPLEPRDQGGAVVRMIAGDVLGERQVARAGRPEQPRETRRSGHPAGPRIETPLPEAGAPVPGCRLARGPARSGIRRRGRAGRVNLHRPQGSPPPARTAPGRALGTHRGEPARATVADSLPAPCGIRHLSGRRSRSLEGPARGVPGPVGGGCGDGCGGGCGPTAPAAPRSPAPAPDPPAAGRPSGGSSGPRSWRRGPWRSPARSAAPGRPGSWPSSPA